MKRRFLLALALALALPVAVGASSKTRVDLNIYPLDCVFETVNDGTNRVVFLTPEECGQNTFVDVPAEVQTPITITTSNSQPQPVASPPVTQIAAQVNATIPPATALPITWVVVSAGVGFSQIAVIISRSLIASLLKLLRFIIRPPGD